MEVCLQKVVKCVNIDLSDVHLRKSVKYKFFFFMQWYNNNPICILNANETPTHVQ